MSAFEVFGKTPDKKSKPIEFDTEMSHKLYNGLKASKLLMKTSKAPSMGVWANQFKILRGYVPEKDINTTLDWFLHHLKDEFTPKAYSAKRFRMEFDRIVEAMTRTGESLVKEQDITISDRARIIQENENLQWPGKEKSQELVFIQLSLDNYEQWKVALRTIYTELKAESDQLLEKRGFYRSTDWKDTTLLGHILATNPHPSELVGFWLREVNQTAWNWAGWQGQLHKYIFKPSADKFDRMLLRRVAEYTGDANRWNRIADLLKRPSVSPTVPNQ